MPNPIKLTKIKIKTKADVIKTAWMSKVFLCLGSKFSITFVNAVPTRYKH